MWNYSFLHATKQKDKPGFMPLLFIASTNGDLIQKHRFCGS